MRFVILILTLVLVSASSVDAQEPAPLPQSRPMPRGDGPAKPDADAGERADRGKDAELAMPELTPLIPETRPAEDTPEVSEQPPAADDVELSEDDASQDKTESSGAAPSDDKAGGVPLPHPKPEATVDKTPDAEAVPDSESEKPPPTIAEAPEQPKPDYDLNEARQCEAALREYAASFEVADPIKGEGQCGWPRPLRLTSLSRDVKIRGSVQLRCEVALALARWAKEVVVPSATLHMGQKPVAVEISTSYQCRRRNNSSTGKISEHGFANGVDLMAVLFEDGKRVAVADRRGSSEGDRAFQAAIRGGACAYFTTVLGPVADANHSNHFHLDLAVRRGGYRLCQ